MHFWESRRKIHNAREELSQKLNRPPTREEIAEYLRISVKDIEKIQQSFCQVFSLDQCVILDDSEGRSLQELVPDNKAQSPEHYAINSVLGDSIQAALQDLSSRERKIICLAFGIQPFSKTTIDKIAEELGVSRTVVRRDLRKALYKIRKRHLSLLSWLQN